MKRNKFRGITNPELLAELEQRSVDLTPDEFTALVSIIIPYREKLMKLLQNVNPRVYQLIQEKLEQSPPEKTDREIEKIKKTIETMERLRDKSNQLEPQKKHLVSLLKISVALRDELLLAIMKTIEYDNENGIAIISQKDLATLLSDWEETTKDQEQEIKNYESKSKTHD